MKSNTTGSSVNVLNKQLRATRLDKAVCRTLEALESRVLMSAGQADQSLYDPNLNGHAFIPADPLPPLPPFPPTLSQTLKGAQGYLQEDTTSNKYVFAPFDPTSVKTTGAPVDLDTYDPVTLARTRSYIDLTYGGTGNRIIKVLTDDAGKIYVVGTRVALQGFQGSYTINNVTDPADLTKKITYKGEVFGTIKVEQMYIARYLPNGKLEAVNTYGGDYYQYINRYSTANLTKDFGDLGTFDAAKGEGMFDVRGGLSKAIYDADNYVKLINTYNEVAVTAAIDPTDGSLRVIFGKVHVGLTDVLDYYMGTYYANGLGCGHAGTNDGMTPLIFQPSNVPTNNGLVRDMRFLSNGDFVLAGDSDPYSNTSTGVEPGLVKYALNHGANTTAATSLATPTFSSYSADSYSAVDVDAQGRIYVVGTTDDSTWDSNNGHQRLIIERYNVDGTLDTTFGNKTQVELTDFGGKNVTGMDIKVQSDGRIVVMGQLDAVPDSWGINGTSTVDTTVVARFNSDGSLDATFTGGGRAYILPAGDSTWLGQSLALQSDGGIVVQGEANGGEIQVMRLTKSGRIDTLFGTSGFGFVPVADHSASYTGDPLGLFPAPRPTMTVNRGQTGKGDDKIIFGWTPFGDDYFDVVRILTTNKAPVANLQAPDVYTSASTAPYGFVVTYTDDELVSGKSVGAIGDVISGLVIYGPDGNPVAGAVVKISNIAYTSLPTLDLNIDGTLDARSITVQYTVDLTNSGIATPVNGLYTIGIAANTVSDTDSLSPLGNVARTLGGFRINVVAPDQTAPAISFFYPDAVGFNDVAAGITTGGASFWDFHVRYSDSSGVDLSTIGDTNLRVTGPRGYNTPAVVIGLPSIQLNGDVVVTYRIFAPGAISATDPAHTWTINSDGIYHIVMQTGQVADLASDPNFIAQQDIAQFNVAIQAVAPAKPTAVLTAPGLTSAGGQFYVFTVTYTDAGSPVNPATITGAELTITGPGGVVFPVTLIGVSTNGNQVQAIYRVAAQTATGVWDVTANGHYTFALKGNSVADAALSYADAQSLGALDVGFETIKPIATLGALVAGKGFYTFTVTFTDASGISVSTIRSANLQLVGSDGTVNVVNLVSVDYNTDGTPRVAIYQLATPVNGGTYRVMLLGAQVKDIVGNFASATQLGTFDIVLDKLPPTVKITLPSITSVTGQQFYQFSVDYFDSGSGVDVLTIGSANIRVLGPDGLFHPVQWISNTVNGNTVTATYELASPTLSGLWDTSANGDYQFFLQPGFNSVSDIAGNLPGANIPVSLGTLTAAIDTQWPTGQLQPLSPLVKAWSYYSITVIYGDGTAVSAASILAGNIKVVGPNGLIISGADVTLMSKTNTSDGSPATDSPSITAVYRLHLPTSATWANGRYGIILQAGQVQDTGGNSNPAWSYLGSFKIGSITGGALDPSFNGIGTVVAGQDPATQIITDPYYSPFVDDRGGVPYTPSLFTWDGVSPGVDAENVIHATTVDSGGRIIVVGEQMGNHIYPVAGGHSEYWDRDFYVARYNADGTLDQALSPNSPLANLRESNYPSVPWSQLDDIAQGVLVEPQYLPDGVTVNPLAGQITVAGTNGVPGGGSNGRFIALARYMFTSNTQAQTMDNLSGPLDVPTPQCYTVTGFSLQAVGNAWKYVVVGSTYDAITGQNFTMWRFNSDGTLDATFGNAGRVVNAGLALPSPFQSFSNDEITAVAVQANGKIDVTGYSDDSVWNTQGGHVRMIVAQYNANGLPDTSFGVNGYIEIGDVRDTDARGNAITIQMDGRIVVAGAYDQFPGITAPDGTPYDTGIVVRVLNNGTLDSTFGTAGRIELTDPNVLQAWRPQNLAIQSDGKIIVGGQLGNRSTQDGFILARLSVNGHMDTTYGNNDGLALLSDLPAGFRETRLDNITGGSNHVGYTYDTTSLVLGAGLDVDKAVIIGNFSPDGIVGSQYEFGGYMMVRVQGDNTPPVAQAQMSNVEVAGAPSYDFYVTYTDNTLIDPATLLANNVVVVAPGGALLHPAPLTLSDITPLGATDDNGNYRQFIVHYTITPPGGTWDIGDNGTYQLRLLPDNGATSGAVKDIEGLPVTIPTPPGYLDLGNFAVIIANPDLIAPIASAPGLATSMTVGGRQTYRFQVIFDDATLDKLSGHGGNIATATLLGNNNVITVRGPNNYQQNARFVSIDDVTDGSPRVVTYEITAPTSVGNATGYWSVVDNGTYTFSLNANQVADDYASANFAQAAEVGRLKIAIVAGQDVYPVAQLTPVVNLTTSQAALQFIVTYSPSTFVNPSIKIDPSSILNNNNAIRVYSAVSGFNLMATPISFIPLAGGAYQVVYQIAPASGLWGIANNGTYTVSVMSAQIRDNDAPANYVQAANLGTFNVMIADVAPPIAAIAIPAPIGAGSVTFNIVFSDNVAVDVSSLGNANVVVIGPHGTRYPAVLVAIDVSTNGTPRVVSYRMDAPGGKWHLSDNGDYHIELQPNQVMDTSGNAVTTAQNIGVGFTVAVEDNVPTAQIISNPNITAAQTTYNFTVRYADDTAVLFTSLAAGNISVIGPNGTAYPVALVGVNINGNGTVRDATYQMAGPGISAIFDMAANGIYHIQLLPSQVSDVFGNFALAGELGTFDVTVDSIAPTASALLTPSITSPIGAFYVFTVQYNDTTAINAATIGSADILVIDPNGASLTVTLLTVNVSNGGKTVVATYRLTAPTLSGVWDVTANGSYQIMMQANRVADRSGNFVVPGNIGSFGVSLETQKPTASLVNGPILILNSPAQALYLFTVTFSDNEAISVATINSADITITGPGGTIYAVTLVGVDVATDGTPRSATYQFDAPGGTFNSGTNGDYSIVLQTAEVADTAGNLANGVNLGTLTVAVNDGVVNGVLTVTGTAAANNVSITTAGTNYHVVVKTLRANGKWRTVSDHIVPISSIRAIVVMTSGGNDSVYIAPSVTIGCYIDAGAGNDVVIGGSGNDTIIGSRGSDTLYGGGGNDLAAGGVGNDLIYGQGGSDILVGNAGADQMFGGLGNDTIYAQDAAGDFIDGGFTLDPVTLGNLQVNRAVTDSLDLVFNIGVTLAIGTLPPPAGPVPSLASSFFASSLLGSSSSSVLGGVNGSVLK